MSDVSKSRIEWIRMSIVRSEYLVYNLTTYHTLSGHFYPEALPVGTC